MVSVIVVGLANLSYSCGTLQSLRERDTKFVIQRTPPSELILFWTHVTRPNKGLSLSCSVGTGRREPKERG